jgi:hypothetical protein
MKQFVKDLNKDGSCIEYIAHKLPRFTMEKLKAVIFNGPQIRQLINDPHFRASMNEIKSCAWSSFVLFVKKISWQQEGRKLHTISTGYAFSFQQAWL